MIHLKSLLSDKEISALQESLSSCPIQSNGRFVYLKLEDSVIFDLFAKILDSDAEIPPFFSIGGVGAHITLISSREFRPLSGSLEKRIDDLRVKSLYTVQPENWLGITKVWCVGIKSKQCKEFRRSLGFPPLIDGHCFHITFAVSKKPVETLLPPPSDPAEVRPIFRERFKPLSPPPIIPELETPEEDQSPIGTLTVLSGSDRRPYLEIPSATVQAFYDQVLDPSKEPVPVNRIELLSPCESPPKKKLAATQVNDLVLSSLSSVTERFGELIRTVWRVEVLSPQCQNLRRSMGLRQGSLTFDVAKVVTYDREHTPLKQPKIPKGPLNQKGMRFKERR